MRGICRRAPCTAARKLDGHYKTPAKDISETPTAAVLFLGNESDGSDELGFTVDLTFT